MAKAREEALMAEALRLAEKARGLTYPNPAVGAVVVKGNGVIGRGYHRRWGAPHAEVVALRQAGKRARGGDLFVTLEPCCHYGRTPPCTDAILERGIRRVYVATLDPNPLVRGKGVRILRRAGIEVRTGLMGRAARKLNESYMKVMKTGRPFVTVKVAETLDGRIANAGGDSKWITSAASRAEVKEMRKRSQAILVGVGTVLRDDPTLLPAAGTGGRYIRCVLDTGLSIPLDSRLVRTAASTRTVVYFNHDRNKRLQQLEKYNVIGVKIGSDSSRAVRIDRVLEHLGRLGVQDLIVEGGARVFTSFVREGLADKLVIFVAPSIMGGEGTLSSFLDVGTRDVGGIRFEVDEVSRISRDVAITLYPGRRARRVSGKAR
ncbi:MAG: bifunctional diaminohydroxyphosphoribosylaminopyrimidine deaminase/5-amino-6-(5-phosphoribosylamino)uracil reductase RibD [bacterium]|jgi:diaminohydroxyphosphoribosylaminopyrimidine deaminase/5-amino-6-(5-phosphoribosylamino)uracil reductase